MTATVLPTPTRRPSAPAVDLRALAADLESEVDGEVRFDAQARGAYATDSSNYRHVPMGVVLPRTIEAAVAAVAVCRRHRAPIVSRGGGTSLAGQTTNTAVVVDFSKYCNRIVSVDADRRSCVVEPGIVLDSLNDALRPYGLEFGPRPATHDHCTIGGMIGNNSCGSTAQRTGKTVDNVVDLEVLLYDGTRMWVGRTSDEEYARIRAAGGRRAQIYRELRHLRDEHLVGLRTRFPRIPRRVSGYNLDSLLPEMGFDVARALVGSEGTLVTVLRARLSLVPVVRTTTLLALAFPDIAEAADAVPLVLAHAPTRLEGLDDQLIDLERHKHVNEPAMGGLPDGRAWLLVEFGDDDQSEVEHRVDAVLGLLGRSRDDPRVGFFETEESQRRMWSVREAGLGATARTVHGTETWPGWEDSAVAPERLGDYLRDLRRLTQEYGMVGVSFYGHFGQGCVHCRLPFDLRSAAGVARFRSFLERAADVVASYGGSLSGEHGDGQARAELLTRMFGEQVVRAFGQMKAIFDPTDAMNPGRVVRPDPLDEHLRLGPDFHQSSPRDQQFGYPDDGGQFSTAVLRCVGVGKCRHEGGGVMCPSYMVTRAEEHSTRGRARLLFEMLDGARRDGAIGDGWRSTAVRDALDLCLACKGCKADCPVNVDMATYKAEFLYHHYRRRLRPRSHYAMGWLPVWARLVAAAPGLVNALAAAPGVSRLAKAAAGIDRRRQLPVFAAEPFTTWLRRQGPSTGGRRGEVMLWPDTFTNTFHPHIGRAAVQVIRDAGWSVRIPERAVCCGLTWISTGQLGVARAVLRRTLDTLGPHLRAGGLVVGLEPSCTAVLRSDARELLPDHRDAARLAQQTVTLAELLADHSDGWRAPSMSGRALVQTHCHQHAIMTARADKAVLEATGLRAELLDSGCCGLAGNFGFEKGHYEVSEACAERVMRPAIRAAAPTDLVLADGFSCRTQIQADGTRAAMHLAEVLLAGMRRETPKARPETEWAPRPERPSRLVTTLAAAGAAAAVGAVARAAVHGRGRS